MPRICFFPPRIDFELDLRVIDDLRSSSRSYEDLSPLSTDRYRWRFITVLLLLLLLPDLYNVLVDGYSLFELKFDCESFSLLFDRDLLMLSQCDWVISSCATLGIVYMF